MATALHPPGLAEADYAHDVFRLAAGLSKNDGHKLPPVPHSLQRLLTRAEEYESAERDQWDNWEHGYSDNFKRGKLWVPECDLWLDGQKKRLAKAGEKLLPPWPKGHDFAVCLTHDVDYIGEAPTLSQRRRELLRCLKAEDLPLRQRLSGSFKGAAKMFLRRSSFSPKTAGTLEASYQIEKEFGVTASYFFTTPPSQHLSKYDCLYAAGDNCHFLGKSRKVRDAMAFLCQEGFDVGLHGSYFSAAMPGMLAEQKAALELAIQSPVSTTRQHWLHFHHPLTLNLQEEAGFQADTTLGFNRNIGFRAGTGMPFYAYDRTLQRRLNLIELPLVIQDGALIGKNALEYSPQKALDIVKGITGQARRTNGCVTFLFHPDIFLKPGLVPLYRSIIAHCLGQNAWVTNLNEIQSWWRKREEALS